MGNSLHDALKAAMLMAGTVFSKGKKPPSQPHKKPEYTLVKEDSCDSASPKLPSTELQEQSFLKHMKETGVKTAQFKNPQVVERQASSDNLQNIPATSPDKLPGKRVVIIQSSVSKNLEVPPVRKQFKKTDESRPAKWQPPPVQKTTTKLEKPFIVKQSASSPSPTEPYSIKVNSATITANPVLTNLDRISNPLIPENDGILEQLCKTRWSDEREVVIGLDFGTACVKAVIGDPALEKAFAVPFSNDIGLSSYLLPSRVWLNDSHYTLSEQGTPRRNLKLSLIDPFCSDEYFIDAVAFLSLVIRRSRGWLLSEHADIYRKIRILWKLTLGLPAATYENKDLVERFKMLAASAWLVAGLQEEELSRRTVERACKEVHENGFAKFREKPELVNIDFDVVPELSAQIYGFLTSAKFDRNAQNIFLMVDVGAGTVDSSVFHVTRGRGTNFLFNFYSNVVEFNGVANLHAERIRWFENAFKENDLLKHVADNIDSIETFTDKLHGIPENLGDYFSGIEISFHNKNEHPDDVFYAVRLKEQVIFKTLSGARESLSSFDAFKGMPVFLCGGGSRMKFYRRLEEDLLHHPNASWFCFRPQQLEVPTILSVPGVKKNEFDRLSVAFGLSFPNVGEYLRKTIYPLSVTSPKVNPGQCPGCGANGTCYCD